jgi:glycosyltransferase involved in cell wall biosynthesis
MTDRCRVLFANDYPMAEARAGWRAGTYPGHHLWGTAHLDEAGFDVVDLSTEDRPERFPRIRAVVTRAMGDPLQQRLALAASRGDVVAYAANPVSFQSLALLHAATERLPPVVIVVHEQPRTAFGRAVVRKADRVITFSETVHGELLAQGVGADRLDNVAWGPDLSFPGFAESSDEGFVLSVGKTRRDLPTLVAALAGSGIEARMFAAPSDAIGAADTTPTNIRFLPGTAPRPPRSPLTYGHVLQDLRRAAVLAIPLSEPRRPYGLTELNDALALRKPVVMTRTPYIDCDIEEVGCGIWVDPGDVEGWRKALAELAADPSMRAEMGERGRAWAEANWHAGLFEAGVADSLARVRRLLHARG